MLHQAVIIDFTKMFKLKTAEHSGKRNNFS